MHEIYVPIIVALIAAIGVLVKRGKPPAAPCFSSQARSAVFGKLDAILEKLSEMEGVDAAVARVVTAVDLDGAPKMYVKESVQVALMASAESGRELVTIFNLYRQESNAHYKAVQRMFVELATLEESRDAMSVAYGKLCFALDRWVESYDRVINSELQKDVSTLQKR